MTTLSWFVLETTNSAFNVGLIGFFGMVPFLVLGVFGGFLADNLNRKRLIVITQFLTFLSTKGETASEIAGGVYVLRNMSKRVNVENCIDTCGTGGDGKNTLNISTASAL